MVDVAGNAVAIGDIGVADVEDGVAEADEKGFPSFVMGNHMVVRAAVDFDDQLFAARRKIGRVTWAAFST